MGRDVGRIQLEIGPFSGGILPGFGRANAAPEGIISMLDLTGFAAHHPSVEKIMRQGVLL